MGDFLEPDSGTAHGEEEDQVVQLAGALIASHALHMVAALGIADLFGDASRTVDDIAAEISADSYALQSVFRLLAGHGLFVETTPGCFALTPRGRLLRTDHPRSLRSIVRLYGFCSPAVLQTEHSLRTGRPSFDKVFGKPFFQYLQSNPHDASLFDDAMADLSRYEGEAILRGYDFSRFDHIVDVGGGDATLLAAILAARPETTGVLLEQSHVTGRAARTRDKAGLGDRLQIAGGDFFTEVPGNGELYLLKSVLQDWPDDRATLILRNCRRAMAPNSRLVIFERMLAPSNAAATMANTLDLAMVLLLGGHGRTAQDYSALFTDSGFALEEIIEAGSGIFAIEAVPA